VRNKWSKVRRLMGHDESVKNFQMVELVQGGKKEPVEEVPPHDCAALQREAFERGRLQGLDEGRAECQDRVDEALKGAIRLANHIGRARVAALEDQERDIVEVALVMTRKLILKEVEVDREVVVRQVRQVLDLLHARELVTRKVHPQDLKTLEPLQERLRTEFIDGDHLVLEAYEDVERGGCLVEHAGLLFDARLSRQLEIVAGEFGVETSRT